MLENRSGKSHINVAVSPVFIDKFSKESSEDITDDENNRRIKMITVKIIWIVAFLTSTPCHI